MKIYSTYTHLITDRTITYFERRWVSSRENLMVCIDAIDIELIGEVQKLIVPIEIWACDTWKERAKNDFLVLELERQVIKFCDGFTLICHIGECEH